MMGLLKKEEVKEHLIRKLVHAESMRVNSFGKMDKCRYEGEVRTLADELEYFGAEPSAINIWLNEARRLASANVINWSTR